MIERQPGKPVETAPGSVPGGDAGRPAPMRENYAGPDLVRALFQPGNAGRAHATGRDMAGGHGQRRPGGVRRGPALAGTVQTVARRELRLISANEMGREIVLFAHAYSQLFGTTFSGRSEP